MNDNRGSDAGERELQIKKIYWYHSISDAPSPRYQPALFVQMNGGSTKINDDAYDMQTYFL